MKPFRDALLGDYLAQISRRIYKKIESLTNEEIMSNDLDILANNIYEEFYVLPITLMDEDTDKRSIKQKKVTKYIEPFFRDFSGREYIEVDGVRASFYYPYTGENELFKCQASVFSLGCYPDIRLENNYLVIDIDRGLNEVQGEVGKTRMIHDLESNMKELRSGISYVNNDVNSFNSRLRGDIMKALQDKKSKVSSFFSIAEMFEVPIEKKEYAKTHIPIQRNIVPISHSYPAESIYTIKEDDYDDIITSIKHTISTFERTPSSFKSMHEEDLRNAVLAALNGIYKGSATGETFRKSGKTDICIEMENRAAFVAECKMWTGIRAVSAALKQLDNYLTWRDCKTALIIFVRKKDFFSVLSKAEQSLHDIPEIKKAEKLDQNEYKCQYLSNSNPGQVIQIRVMLFNLYYDE